MSDKPKVYLEDTEINVLTKIALIKVNANKLIEIMKKSLDPKGDKSKRLEFIEKHANGEGNITLQGKGTNDFQII